MNDMEFVPTKEARVQFKIAAGRHIGDDRISLLKQAMGGENYRNHMVTFFGSSEVSQAWAFLREEKGKPVFGPIGNVYKLR